jgi:hypothetical protein
LFRKVDGHRRVELANIRDDCLKPGKDQLLRLYDSLTPRGADVRPQDLTRYVKSERFGVTGKVVRTERPRSSVRILRDRWDVPHLYGRTRPDVEFGAGYEVGTFAGHRPR